MGIKGELTYRARTELSLIALFTAFDWGYVVGAA